jgi:epsin
MSKVMRSIKNVAKGYSPVQIQVRNGVFRFPCSNEDGHLLICTATSNDPWGPTVTEMYEIAQMTSDSTADFYEVMDMLDKRLNDKGKNWRHPLKALKVLDYALHAGSEFVVTWARKNVYIIRNLREFHHLDEDGRDVGQDSKIS